MELDDVRAFILVAERGSVTAAARLLGVTKSTVSRRLQRLEHDLGLPLLARSANRVRLTDYGEMFQLRCGPALAEVDDAALALQGMHSEPSGLLRLTMPEGLGNAQALTTIIIEFQEAHPRVDVEVFATHRVLDLVEEGIDIAIRRARAALDDSDDGYRMRVLGEVPLALYAASGAPQPQSLAEAGRQIRVVHTGLARNLTFTSARGASSGMDLKPRITTNSVGQVLHATLSGYSIGLLPVFQAAVWVESGRLVQVCPEWTVPSGSIALVWPGTRHLSPRVRAFIDYFAERALSSGLVVRRGATPR